MTADWIGENKRFKRRAKLKQGLVRLTRCEFNLRRMRKPGTVLGGRSDGGLLVGCVVPEARGGGGRDWTGGVDRPGLEQRTGSVSDDRCRDRSCRLEQIDFECWICRGLQGPFHTKGAGQ